MNIYELKNIRKDFKDFSLHVDHCCLKEGEIYVLIGPNGCGKTTFLNLLSFLDQPSSGELFFRGRNASHANAQENFLKTRDIGYLLQNPYLFNMSVYDNVAYGLKLRGVEKEIINKKIKEILDKLSLSHLAQKNIHFLSGGEAQKVAIARTLVLDSDILILDEPTANVDKNNINAVEDIIHSLRKNKKKTVLVTTHTTEQAYRLSKNTISIINGHLKPLAYENVFSAEAQEEKGVWSVSLGQNIRVKLNHGKRGRVTIAIDPNDIILSNKEFESSALNKFLGVIKKIEDRNGSLSVFVDVGTTFCALITHRSFHQMKLNIGKKVWITFKANSIKRIDHDII